MRYHAGMDARSAVIADPHILHGTPVFRGTRVPVKTLFDYLAAGEGVDAFLEGFPGVSREQIAAVLDAAGEVMERHCASVA